MRLPRALKPALPLISAALVLAAWPGSASATAPDGPEGPPNVDLRTQAPAAVPPGASGARRSLEKALGPLAEVRTDRAGGGVAYVGRPTGLLTGPSTAGPQRIVLDYLRDNHQAFRLSEHDLDNLELTARSVSPDGITHLRFNQVLDGIPSFDNGIEGHVTADGRLITVSGAPVPGAELPARQPDLSAPEALAAAHDAIPRSGPVPRRVETEPGPARATGFAGGERAELRWTSGPDGPRLVWWTLAESDEGNLYDILVDAEDGDLLRRQILTHDAGLIHRFPSSPDGPPTETVQMPPAWYDQHAGGTRLWGQYSRTYTDPEAENPAPGHEFGGNRAQVPSSNGSATAPDWLYDLNSDFHPAFPCPPSGCTWAPPDLESSLVNRWQAGANVHGLVSKFHDHLIQAPIGFDEASGNFQRVNLTGQGLGDDYVRTEYHDGAGYNNANMSTPPDGQAPRMQMYLWSLQGVNGTDTADVVYHEYTHGLSNRLVVNANGSSTLFAAQPRMMGEAWSDFYALDLLETEGLVVDTPVPGEVKMGEYVVGSGGIRAKPIDCPVDPAGVDGCNGVAAGFPAVPGGYTYADIALTRNVSPHNGGEIWAETLWEIRTAVGRQAALVLVTGGLRLAPDNPSMLDARDAILLQAIATRSAPGAADDHYWTLWEIFAGRGLGASASTPGPDSTEPVEAYDLPTGLRTGSTAIRDPYPGGDNDGVVEPGERFVIHQPVQATGPLDVPGVSGTLSTDDPAVTVESGSAGWPLLGQGRWAVNQDELAGRLAPGQCQATSPIEIEVTSPAGDATATAAIDPRPGSREVVLLPDAGGTRDKPIPRSTDATFEVSSDGIVSDVDLRIDELRHSELGGLRIDLLHAGVAVTIADEFGEEPFDLEDIVETVFDDDAPSEPTPDLPSPLTGRFKPDEPLTAFNGLPAGGAWTLRVTDKYPFYDGELHQWGLDSPEVPCGRPEIPAASTGGATGITHSSAKIDGSVTPNGRATGLRFSYGPTPDYGSSTPVRSVGSGDEARTEVTDIAGLSPETTYHYRVEAIRENGVVAVVGEDKTFTTPARPVDPDRKRPSFRGKVRVKLGKARNRNRRPAALRFRLSEPARVTAKLSRVVRGRLRGARCVPPGRAKGKPCFRRVAVGRFTRSFARSGAGRLPLGARGLRAGRYVVTLVAVDAAGNRSRRMLVRFRVR